MKCDYPYHPTLWRSCRVLANLRRLACLKAVLAEPGAAVGDVADKIGIPPNQASLALRALQARGLLSATREGRAVRYSPVPDPLVDSAKPLLSALRRLLTARDVSEKEIFHAATAFTHPRRLAMVSCLARRGPLPAETLAAANGISYPAATRHIKKLASREIIVK
jgi:DNA-binding transcriptional ArsR family regulator